MCVTKYVPNGQSNEMNIAQQNIDKHVYSIIKYFIHKTYSSADDKRQTEQLQQKLYK